MRNPLRTLVPALGALCLLVSGASATWSIVVVNTKTGEVGIAGATCIPNSGIKPTIAVVRVGHGAAAAQAAVGGVATRQLIWNGFINGDSPAQILLDLEAFDPSHQSRQYGIVDLFHDPIGFTGSIAGEGKLDVWGTVGDLKYSIQGNVLTGPEVVLAAETALLTTPGDLGQKIMAGMEWARRLGGDGRCSCSIGNPTGCGVPPRNFTKSNHTAFIVVARIGDTDGVCQQSNGCANGDYYLSIKNKGGIAAPDPLYIIEELYAEWRLTMVGVVDQVHSEVGAPVASIRPQGATHIKVRLRDIEQAQILQGGAQFTLTNLSGNPDVTVPGAVIDHGDGTYTIPVAAGTAEGTDLWRVSADDGFGTVVLQPDVSIQVSAP